MNIVQTATHLYAFIRCYFVIQDVLQQLNRLFNITKYFYLELIFYYLCNINCIKTYERIPHSLR